MMKISNQTKFLTLVALTLCVVLGGSRAVNGQQGRDPFEKPNWEKPKDPNAGKTTKVDKDGKIVTVNAKPAIVPVTAPDIQARINYYKMLREQAAQNGEPLPKVTSVLTLDEMSITGIFRTPRGYAAMVQANPINLSYTVYPGEKFFNGQLVAVEENRVVFRKVVKMSNGKFITSEENKTLRQYTQQEEIQGTAPSGTTTQAEARPAETQPSSADGSDSAKTVQPTVVVSPLDEMNRQPVETPESAKDKKTNKKSSARKKTTKVARGKKQ